jgi:Zn-dependent peptidase ImmA (M78 family)
MKGIIAMGLAKSQAKEQAASLLDRYCRDAAGAINLPIDPVEIARQIGVSVFDAELPPNVSGALRKEKGGVPAILLNVNDAPVRRRFTCAHELGHYVDRVETNENLDDYSYIDNRDGTSSLGTDPKEVFANAFAAELLMPEELVEQMIKGTTVIDMAAAFGVSAEAMKNRISNYTSSAVG